MRGCRKWLLIVSLLGGIWFAAPPASAFEPMSMISSLPAALRLMENTRPYLTQCAVATGRGFMNIGTSTARILYLPLGVLESTAGMPFGFFDRGIQHTVKGATAPFELLLHVIILPANFLGAEL